ncbi:type IV pilus biogenesis protein PilM [Crenobacter sp. SG2305]|uniref:type IV pilus biogenesis protein PilM n=1 Tax=Crenobacter oryzisoli TaxID=3056844 RepID=UPI0025AA7A88|nr:type IV pilus biogenesis protein PilM [Crenobacter sp. SG2305]MDN0082472.1 type IV pilus biogenesis protein PilM [Crenobacter sp. SG2305]
MWPLWIAVFGVAMVATQFAMHQSSSFEVSQTDQTTQLALEYATAVSTYLRNNPNATSPATAAQLNLPAWYPMSCNGQPCFDNAFAGGRAYITPKQSVTLSIGSVQKIGDGSLIAGSFTNVSTGAFQSQYGTITLPVPAGATANLPTIVVSP